MRGPARGMFRLPYQTRHRYTGNQVPAGESGDTPGDAETQNRSAGRIPARGGGHAEPRGRGGMPTPRFWARDAGLVQPPSGVGSFGGAHDPRAAPGAALRFERGHVVAPRTALGTCPRSCPASSNSENSVPSEANLFPNRTGTRDGPLLLRDRRSRGQGAAPARAPSAGASAAACCTNPMRASPIARLSWMPPNASAPGP